jgi:uncharacterized protein (DUF362 family)
MIIAGANPVAVDEVGTKFLGKNPFEIGHITLAAQQRLGTCNIQKIEVKNKGYELN